MSQYYTYPSPPITNQHRGKTGFKQAKIAKSTFFDRSATSSLLLAQPNQVQSPSWQPVGQSLEIGICQLKNLSVDTEANPNN
jgi:hypothetical protein